MFLRGLWDVFLNVDLIEISQRHLMPAGLLVGKSDKKEKRWFFSLPCFPVNHQYLWKKTLIKKNSCKILAKGLLRLFFNVPVKVKTDINPNKQTSNDV